jgi:hypothetical protein
VRAGLGSASQLLPNSDSLALCRYARSALQAVERWARLEGFSLLLACLSCPAQSYHRNNKPPERRTGPRHSHYNPYAVDAGCHGHHGQIYK